MRFGKYFGRNLIKLIKVNLINLKIESGSCKFVLDVIIDFSDSTNLNVS